MKLSVQNRTYALLIFSNITQRFDGMTKYSSYGHMK